MAETAAEMIVQANGQPLSMGVSGGWGAGKSSMLSLISESLRARDDHDYLFVHFNAWLYQGYDDARAAMLQVIAERLVEHGEGKNTALDDAKELLARVNWLRVAGLTASSVLSVATGLPAAGLVGATLAAGKRLFDRKLAPEDIEAAEEAGAGLAAEAGRLLGPKEELTPPRQIEDLRTHFVATLEKLDVTLVVCVDDLDRCLPATSIATLEAIRLFLFLPRTAFVIAADDRMLRQAVRVHFGIEDLADDFITNYFDKLVQVPLRVPPLGTQEVRAYLMLLFVDNSDLACDERERVRVEVCRRLADSWKGERVDLRFVNGLIKECPAELRANLEIADRLAPLMTTAKQISGNPRLIKRFLNTLSIRLSMAAAQHVAVDEGALAKMLLFERCGSAEAYAELVSAVNDGDEGRPEFLSSWEERAREGEELEDLPNAWRGAFVRDWLALSPAFGDMDLRPVVYVSREHMPIVAATDQLSSNAIEILEALVRLDRPSDQLAEQLLGLPGRDVAAIRERLMVQARQVQEWGTPGVLWGLMTVVKAAPDAAPALSGFFESVPVSRVRADVVPVLVREAWADDALKKWRRDEELAEPVRKAIEQLSAKPGSGSSSKGVN
ncbi:MAG: P-loop NTPase fold protein [Acidobacteriota bacterium]|nr:P-loop NTPase fold protein [Acidobacteriota bacterium]